MVLRWNADDLGPAVDRNRQRQPTGVVGVFTDQIDATRRPRYESRRHRAPRRQVSGSLDRRSGGSVPSIIHTSCVNVYVAECRYCSPGLSTHDPNPGWLGVSGSASGSRQTPENGWVRYCPV